MPKVDDEPKDIMLYEEVMARLETIVRQLEGGRATLAESLSLYEEAQQLSRTADRLLNFAEAMLEPPSSSAEPS